MNTAILLSGLLLSFSGEIKPIPAATPAVGVRDKTVHPEVAVAITGVNSRLKAPQRATITDQKAWQRVWAAHHGAIDPNGLEQIPDVDFRQQMIVAIVETQSELPFGIDSVRLSRSGPEILFDYGMPRRSQIAPPAEADNVFGFFVIPRVSEELVLRNGAQGTFKQTARFRDGTAVVKKTVQPDDVPEKKLPVIPPPSHAGRLNIGFAYDPGTGNYNGVVGTPGEVWNFVDIGTTAIDYLRHPNATSSKARLRITRHDGEWAINSAKGIYRGYIYHNCQCVDLEVKVLDLPSARYRAHVFAHGDRPEQNAEIEIVVGDQSAGRKKTANDGTWEFRSNEYEEGVQFVSIEFEVPPGKDVRIISHRDGSGYSMFNAIQLVPIAAFTERQNED